jgi:hypothetical protein
MRRLLTATMACLLTMPAGALAGDRDDSHHRKEELREVRKELRNQRREEERERRQEEARARQERWERWNAEQDRLLDERYGW